MASADASKADGAWAREQWRRDPPELSDFVLVKEPRERGDYAWTWRVQEKRLSLVKQHMLSLIKTRDRAVFEYSRYIVRFYPMFGGVRRQLRRMLHGASKLWIATTKTEWHGQDPAALPAMVGYRKESDSHRRTHLL